MEGIASGAATEAERLERLESLELEERVASGTATEAERLEWLDSLGRRGLLRSPDSIYVDCTNSDTVRINTDINQFLGLNRPVKKTEFLAMERLIWIAAMDYWKSKDMCSEYDLLPDNMTLYPVVFEKHTWYHCNLLVRRRGPEYPSILIFVEVKCKWESTKGRCYDVIACTAPGENSCYNCGICPPSMDILHPLSGGFTCGSKGGQKVFHYSIPGTPCSSDLHHGEAISTRSSIIPIETTMKSTVFSEAVACSFMSLESCSGLQGVGGTSNSALIDGTLPGQLIKCRRNPKAERTERFVSATGHLVPVGADASLQLVICPSEK